jgi:LPS export ABC transporter protein LptC
MVVVKNEQEVSVFDEGLHLVFFTPEGKPQSDLTANYGEFRKEFGEAEVRGNVIVINEKGDRIETEKLMWDSAKDSIYTNEFVKVYTENEIIYGDGIRAKSDFSAFRFFHIRGAIKLEEGEPAPAIPGDNKPADPAPKPGGNP